MLNPFFGELEAFFGDWWFSWGLVLFGQGRSPFSATFTSRNIEGPAPAFSSANRLCQGADRLLKLGPYAPLASLTNS